MTDAELRTPTNRVCELCDRREVWDPSATTWRIEVADEELQVGNAYCIHEWDVNGTFPSFES